MQVKRKPIFPIGVDEAGRGAWAGPVCAGCFVVLEKKVTRTKWYGELTDSKMLTEKERERLFSHMQKAKESWLVDFSVAFSTSKEIDEFWIKEANRIAMLRCLQDLSTRLELPLPPVWIDGRDNYRFPELPFPIECEFFVWGDLLHKNIGAASIAAKVSRDRYMANLETSEKYGFSHHKGYGTPGHQGRLAEHGSCEEHRASFAPIKNLQSTSKDL